MESSEVQELFSAEEINFLQATSQNNNLNNDQSLDNNIDRTYLLQPNVISRSINDIEATEKKLMTLAMSYIPQKIESDDDYTVTFTISDAIKALDMTDGQKQRMILENAIDKISGSQIKIYTDNGDWFKYTWFDHAAWLPTTKTFSLSFNKSLGNALLQYKKAYAKLDLAYLGRLSSKYSIRYFEIGMSYAGNKGINGNKKGTWYFEYTIEQLRQLFSIEDSKYKRMTDFTRRIVYDPIELLNNAKVGFEIDPQPIKRGKNLIAFHFVCTETKPEPRKHLRSSSANSNTADEDDSFETLKNKYPEEYQEIIAQVEQEKKTNPEMKFVIAEYEALSRLAKLHPEE
ncbi:MAG: replication initiation protein [Treponema sp.]|nr:replication initiation protein [Treponema sp.]